MDVGQINNGRSHKIIQYLTNKLCSAYAIYVAIRELLFNESMVLREILKKELYW